MTRHSRVIVLAATLAAAPVQAQSWSPIATDVFTTIGSVQLSSAATWRGLDRGQGRVAAGGAVSRGGPGAGSVITVLGVDGQSSIIKRTTVTDMLHAFATVAYQLDDANNLIWGTLGGMLLPRANVDRATVEVGGGVRFALPVWLPERHPRVIVEGAYDLSRYKAAYVRTALRLDYKLTPAVGVFIEGGYAMSGLPGADSTGSVPFESHGADVTLTVVHQTDPAKVSTGQPTVSIEPYLKGNWMRRNKDPNLFDLGVKLTVVL